ncbi:uncharacterized protein LOC117331395 isoform X1 [Pecten maximus]|uniref:uncharacterized protein LOC117331395 isoform X1 n=1 Tax=Pecten maximus TaxID=6579 RepID=UPI00145830F8|nr:uncharacterized protein LOC117331395 isoform X1 [Pecten maximus]
MDNQAYKRRVRSGNTLRASITRDSDIYRRQSYPVHQSKDKPVITLLEDLGIDTDDVDYSINKKGRWLVPQILKQEIINSNDEIHDLVHCHKSFYSSNGFLKKLLPQRTCMHLDTCRANSEALTIDIVTLCPITSSLDHNTKYTGKCGSNDISHKKSNPYHSKTNRHRKTMSKGLTMDEYLDFSEDEDEDIDPNEDTYKRPRGVSFGDILVHSSEMQKLLSIDISNPCKDSLTASYDQHSIYNTDRENNHVTFSVLKTDVLTGHLRRIFGGDYIECRCLPRKFLIDITDKVTSAIFKSNTSFNKDLRQIDLSTVLIFAYDMIVSQNITDNDFFRVSISMKTTQMCLRIDTLPENSVFGIEEIVQGAVSYIESLPFDSFIPRNSPKPHTTSVNNYNNILKLCNKEATVFTTENFTIKDILKENSTKRYEIEENDDFEMIPPDTCSICMESLLECSATALQTCGHWFCNRCWNDHVTTASSGRSGKVTCPQYSCRCPVGYDILFTVSNLQTLEGMFRRQISSHVEKDPNSRWCPNEACGRVIKYIKTGQNTNVACECGTCFCFDCLQSVHWPLSCRDYDKYLEKLKDNGHIDKALNLEEKIPYDIQGKHCPVCKVFMEKTGGCMSISCICGAIFCWACLKERKFHRRKICFPWRKWKYGDMYKLKRKRIITSKHGPDYEKPAWYKRAVEIRTMLNPSRVKSMSSAVQYMWRTLRSSGTELEKYEDNHIIATDQIRPFLSSMVSLFLELTPVCEYTTVFLEESKDERLVQLRDRLQRMTEEICSIFISSHNLDLKSSISRLIHLRFECEKVFKIMFTTVE